MWQKQYWRGRVEIGLHQKYFKLEPFKFIYKFDSFLQIIMTVYV